MYDNNGVGNGHGFRSQNKKVISAVLLHNGVCGCAE